jgi:hypothetical protein
MQIPPPDQIAQVSVSGRRDLIQQLASYLDFECISSPVWVYLWLADIEKLHEIVHLISKEDQTARLVIKFQYMKKANQKDLWPSQELHR